MCVLLGPDWCETFWADADINEQENSNKLRTVIFKYLLQWHVMEAGYLTF